jgi:hypothetical protein
MTTMSNNTQDTPREDHNADKEKRDYDVGYKKPPKAHQFKPGKSGNPAGRPKGSKNLKTLVNQVADSRVTVNQNGRRRSISVREASLMKLAEAGLNMKLPALFKLIDLLRVYDEDDVHEMAAELSEEDAQILEIFAAKIRDAQKPDDDQMPEDDQKPEDSQNG